MTGAEIAFVMGVLLVCLAGCAGSKTQDDKQFDLNVKFSSPECEFTLQNEQTKEEGRQAVEVTGS